MHVSKSFLVMKTTKLSMPCLGRSKSLRREEKELGVKPSRAHAALGAHTAGG